MPEMREAAELVRAVSEPYDTTGTRREDGEGELQNALFPLP